MNNQKERQIKVGVAGILLRDNKILMCRRNKPPEKGMWGFPAGHLEFKEKLEDCIIRECKEEAALEVKVEKLISVASIMVHGNHYIIFTFLVFSLNPRQEPELLEPENHQEWKWFDLNNLPDNLFITAKNSLRDFKSGKIYYSKKIKLEKIK